MVRGVDRFKDYFKNYTGQYTLIGGAACDIILGELGEDFRATKDIDMVLILEELQEDFANTFIRSASPFLPNLVFSKSEEHPQIVEVIRHFR